MTGPELARLILPLLKPAGIQRLRPLRIGETTDVALRWADVSNWDAMTELLCVYVDILQLYDGEEWFTIAIEPIAEKV